MNSHPSSDGAPKPLRLLLVEDSDDDRALISAALEKLSTPPTLRETNSLTAGLAVVAKSPIDCVLLDWNLGGGSGLDFLQALNGQPGERVPVVVLTGGDDEATAMRALAAGAQDYLVKGRIDGGQILRAVRYAMERVRSARYELRLAEFDRLNALNQMASMLAHEINNPLSYVNANLSYLDAQLLQLLSSSTRPGDEGERRAVLEELRQVIAETRQGGARLVDIVSELQVLSRPSHARGQLDVCEVLNSVVKLSEPRLGGPVIKTFSDVPSLSGMNESRLAYVFTHLLLFDAKPYSSGAPSPSALRIEVREVEPGAIGVEFDRPDLKLNAATQGRATGSYFQDQPAGQATQAGLRLCQSILSDAGGSLITETAAGGGTRFRVTLPAAPLEK